MQQQKIRRAQVGPAEAVEPASAPVGTEPERLARMLFNEYSGSPSGKLGIVLLNRDDGLIGTELILNPNVNATCYTPEFVEAVLKDACALVPFSYRPHLPTPGNTQDFKFVMTLRNWLLRSGREIRNHLMIFGDGHWRIYGQAGHVASVRSSVEGKAP